MKDLNSLNNSLRCWSELEVNDGIFLVPIHVHIKDISDYKEDISDFKIDILRESVSLNETNNPFIKEIYTEDYKSILESYFKFIDNSKLYENNSMDFFEMLEKYKMDKYQIFDEGNFVQFKKEIDYYVNKIKFEFLVNCRELFEYDKEMPDIYVRDDMPKNIREAVNYPLNMTMLQSDIEYPSNIIFPENIGKARIEHSFREVQVKTMYLHMKNKKEGLLNKYQASKIEEQKNNKR